jgi:hypothetical protein
VEVVAENRYFVPAYLFYCTGTSPFTYGFTNVRLGMSVQQSSLELTHMSSSATATATFLAPGNKEMIPLIKEFYFKERIEINVKGKEYGKYAEVIETALKLHPKNLSRAARHLSGSTDVGDFEAIDVMDALQNGRSSINRILILCDDMLAKLVDVEFLDFPNDAIVHEYNIPPIVSFNEYARPHMDALLRSSAEASLKGKAYRDLTMGGGNIQKDNEVRVLLGIYQVVYTCEGKEYSFYATGDGLKVIHDEMPKDTERENIFAEKTKAMEAARTDASITGAGCLSVFFGLAVIVLIFIAAWFETPLYALISLLPIVATILFGIIGSKKKKAKKAVVAALEKDLRKFNSLWTTTIMRFKQEKKGLSGIYEQIVAGNENAF